MNGCDSRVYMNNAATSWPKPPGVAEAMAKAVRDLPGAANRGGIQDFDVFAAVREELAALMGVSRPERIALGCHSTWALNEGIFGYPLEKGDAVLTTAAEHNAVRRPLIRLESEGIRVIRLPVDGAGRVRRADWERALGEERPKLCVLTHASNVTGAVNDVSVLAKAAREAGAAFLLDASQTLGCVPVEPERWGVDLTAFTGHKYLLGPQGTGGLYVRPGLTLKPYLLGGTGVLSESGEMPEEMPLHLEAGTGNEPSYHGLLAALLWSREHPLAPGIWKALTGRLIGGLQELGCAVVAPEGPVTPVVSFLIPGISPADAADILTGSYDIICRVGLHCAPDIMKDLRAFCGDEGVSGEARRIPDGGTIRLSLSRFTTWEEIDRVLAAVKDIVESVL